MPEHRHHSDVLIAGSIVLGTLGLLGGLLDEALDLDHVGKAIVFFIASFLAAALARRSLADLTVSEVGIAAAVMIAVVFGIKYERSDRAIDLDLIGPVVVAEIGALAGAFAVRYRGVPNGFMLSAVAAAGGFGASLLAIGLSLLAQSNAVTAIVALVAGPVGSALVARYIDGVRPVHAALGLGLTFGALVAIGNDPHPLAGFAIGAILGLVLGGIGGRIGASGRLRAERKPDLPEVRQVS